jgi:hypothetical protein
MIKRLSLALGILLLATVGASAQSVVLWCYNSATGFQTTQPCPGNKNTTNAAVVITTGGTFQSVLAASATRASLTVENNNATDSCWVYVGATGQTEGKSILLIAGGSYTRYFPYVPADEIQATCANSSDTLYVDYQ